MPITNNPMIAILENQMERLPITADVRTCFFRFCILYSKAKFKMSSMIKMSVEYCLTSEAYLMINILVAKSEQVNRPIFLE